MIIQKSFTLMTVVAQLQLPSSPTQRFPSLLIRCKKIMRIAFLFPTCGSRRTCVQCDKYLQQVTQEKTEVLEQCYLGLYETEMASIMSFHYLSSSLPLYGFLHIFCFSSFIPETLGLTPRISSSTHLSVYFHVPYTSPHLRIWPLS